MLVLFAHLFSKNKNIEIFRLDVYVGSPKVYTTSYCSSIYQIHQIGPPMIIKCQQFCLLRDQFDGTNWHLKTDMMYYNGGTTCRCISLGEWDGGGVCRNGETYTWWVNLILDVMEENLCFKWMEVVHGQNQGKR